jgi:hypothetical protein
VYATTPTVASPISWDGFGFPFVFRKAYEAFIVSIKTVKRGHEIEDWDAFSNWEVVIDHARFLYCTDPQGPRIDRDPVRSNYSRSNHKGWLAKAIKCLCKCFGPRSTVTIPFDESLNYCSFQLLLPNLSSFCL